MDYIYDIVLNFQDEYYDFYEWKQTDKIINIKKILIYKTNDKNYLDLKYNEIILDNEKIPLSTKMFLITNEKEVMGILLDKEGKIKKRSSLLLDESEEIIDEKNNIKEIEIKYKMNIYKPQISYSRIFLEKRKFLEKYFFKIDIVNDKYLLKYIYYDIYKKEENNINEVYKCLKELIENNIDKIYNSIKKVNMELKR